MEVISVKLPSREDIINAAAIAKTSYYDAPFETHKKKLDYGDAVEFLKKLFLGDRPSDRHESVIEHLIFTFNIVGVSRALTHQLVRHRIASYIEKSFRKKRKIEFLVPESDHKEDYEKAYAALSNLYNKLIAEGEEPEDARLVLPQGVLTEISMTMNARALRNFLTQRLAKAAGKEIRILAKLIVQQLIDAGEVDLFFLVEDIVDKHNKGLL